MVSERQAGVFGAYGVLRISGGIREKDQDLRFNSIPEDAARCRSNNNLTASACIVDRVVAPSLWLSSNPCADLCQAPCRFAEPLRTNAKADTITDALHAVQTAAPTAPDAVRNQILVYRPRALDFSLS